MYEESTTYPTFIVVISSCASCEFALGTCAMASSSTHLSSAASVHSRIATISLSNWPLRNHVRIVKLRFVYKVNNLFSPHVLSGFLYFVK